MRIAILLAVGLLLVGCGGNDNDEQRGRKHIDGL